MRKPIPASLQPYCETSFGLRDCRAAGSHQIVDDQHHVIFVEGIHVHLELSVPYSNS